MAISLIIVAHNEEKHIGETISSAYDFVDEIVLVDAASTDNTIKTVEALDKEKKLKVFFSR
ncbi:MAG: N-glycosyltransferase [Microgenomates bacterium OLB23]|nr:MAG: N-glycosyltransferase [Microgenomates bacterium OLB23]